MKKTFAFVRLIALALVVMLVVSCSSGSGGGQPASSGGGTTQKAEEKAEEKPAEKEAAKDEAKPADSGNVPTLIWFMGDPGVVPPEQAKVEEVLDKISVEKVGVKVKTLYYKDENIKLAFSSGENWDISFTCEWFNNFAVQARDGYFADLTEKLPSVAPKLYDTMPETVWEGAKIDGKIMAIPVKKDYAAEIFYIFDKALYADLGMEIPDKMDFFDIEKYLKAAKDAFAAGNPLAEQAENPLKLIKGGFAGLDGNFDMINRDVLLGIPYSAVGTADANKIVVTVETPDVYDRLVAINNWYKAGYINTDAATVDDVGKYSAVKTGQGFYGADAIWTGANGYVCQISKFSGPYLSTASIRGAMNAISAKSKNIDLALKFQELVNTDQEYRDILRYGIEGDHWERTSNGLVKRTEGGRKGYQPWPFSQGSYSLSTVEAAEGVDVDPDMWKVIFDGYKDLVATNTIGFSFDITPVDAQVAACRTIKEKYWAGLATGTLDPAETIPTMIKEMEAAGLRDIQAECQAQFDKFLNK